MEASDLFWFLSVIAAYCGELADEGIGLDVSLRVGAVLDDLCRLAGVPSPRFLDAAIGNLALLPVEPAGALIG